MLHIILNFFYVKIHTADIILSQLVILCLPVWQMIAFFSTSIATRFQLDEFPSVVTICIWDRPSFDLHLTDRNQCLVSDNLYFCWIALCSVCLQRGHLAKRKETEGSHSISFLQHMMYQWDKMYCVWIHIFFLTHKHKENCAIR